MTPYEHASKLTKMLEEDCTHGTSDYESYGPCESCITTVIVAAIAEERERCAKMVEDWLTLDEVTGRDGMLELAAAMRGGAHE